MTNDEINRSIAEFCGVLPTVGEACFPVPDYCSDLNAIAEAVKALTNSQRHHYRNVLGNICCPDGVSMSVKGKARNAIDATAHQRATALTIVIGK